MQRLNVTRVNAAARKAYKVRKLSAQHPKRAMRKCNYQVGDEIVRWAETTTPASGNCGSSRGWDLSVRLDLVGCLRSGSAR